MRYNEGEAFARDKQWKFAESAYTEATKLKPAFPSNGTASGIRARCSASFPRRSAAYEEALRLKPDYPQALEYLGETYVGDGQDGRRTRHARQAEAARRGARRQARQAIDSGKSAGSW